MQRPPREATILMTLAQLLSMVTYLDGYNFKRTLVRVARRSTSFREQCDVEEVIHMARILSGMRKQTR